MSRIDDRRFVELPFNTGKAPHPLLAAKIWGAVACGGGRHRVDAAVNAIGQDAAERACGLIRPLSISWALEALRQESTHWCTIREACLECSHLAASRAALLLCDTVDRWEALTRTPPTERIAGALFQLALQHAYDKAADVGIWAESRAAFFSEFAKARREQLARLRAAREASSVHSLLMMHAERMAGIIGQTHSEVK